jgi:hypothetical protein
LLPLILRAGILIQWKALQELGFTRVPVRNHAYWVLSL